MPFNLGPRTKKTIFWGFGTLGLGTIIACSLPCCGGNHSGCPFKKNREGCSSLKKCETGCPFRLVGNTICGPNGESSRRVFTADYYHKIKKEIKNSIEDVTFDDGSWGPVLVRLAWHSSGTFSKACPASYKGGSDGGLMRFTPQALWGANAGLGSPRGWLENISKKHPEISTADLWTLAGCVAVETMGGPKIPWKPGRTDFPENTSINASFINENFLPNAELGANHIRDIFGRLGFNDEETVALIGAHTVGRCHESNSGFEGPWTFSPTTFSNQFFIELLEQEWEKVKLKNGKVQYMDKNHKIMMLPADMALKTDAEFLKYSQRFAQDEKYFFSVFSMAFSRLLELGVDFPDFTYDPFDVEKLGFYQRLRLKIFG